MGCGNSRIQESTGKKNQRLNKHATAEINEAKEAELPPTENLEEVKID
jgi:hypothetical protein